MKGLSINLTNSNRTRNYSQTNSSKKKTKVLRKMNFNNYLSNDQLGKYSPLNNVFSSLDSLNQNNSIKRMLLSKNKPIFLSEVSSVKNISSFGSRRIRRLTTNFSQQNLKSYMKKNENLLKTFFQKTRSLENIMKQKEYEYDDLNKFKFSRKKALDDLYFNKNDLKNIIEKESIAKIKLQKAKRKYNYVTSKLEEFTTSLKHRKNICLKNLKFYSKNNENFNIINKENQNLFDTLKNYQKNVRLLSPVNAKLFDGINYNEEIQQIQKSVQDDNDKRGNQYKEEKEDFFRQNEFYKHLIQLNNDIAYKYRSFFAGRLGFNWDKSYTAKKNKKRLRLKNINKKDEKNENEKNLTGNKVALNKLDKIII